MAWTASVLATRTVNRNVDDPTISITPVTGDTLLVLGIYIDEAVAEGDLTSVSDDQGNTWVLAESRIGTPPSKTYLYYVDGPVIAATVITVVTSGTTDTVINAATFQGDFDTVGDTGQGSTSGQQLDYISTTSDDIDSEEADSLIIVTGGRNNNGAEGGSTFSRGGMTLIDDGANGGAEKFYGIMIYEILTIAVTNEDFLITMSKNSTTMSCAAAEFKLTQVVDIPNKINQVNQTIKRSNSF